MVQCPKSYICAHSKMEKYVFITCSNATQIKQCYGKVMVHPSLLFHELLGPKVQSDAPNNAIKCLHLYWRILFALIYLNHVFYLRLVYDITSTPHHMGLGNYACPLRACIVVITWHLWNLTIELPIMIEVMNLLSRLCLICT